MQTQEDSQFESEKLIKPDRKWSIKFKECTRNWSLRIAWLEKFSKWLDDF